MRYTDFGPNAAGRLVPTLFGQRAFVPDDLPPRIDLTRTAGRLVAASAAIGELKGACRRLPNAYMLIRPLQRLEAQTSSAMEGTYTTANELAIAEAGLDRNGKSEAIEVANYTRALQWAETELRSVPISSRLLRGAHGILLRGVGGDRGQHKLPGEFKRDQNMIGGHRLDTARFIPPPPDDAMRAMTALERFINRDDKSPGLALVDLALVHYQFETIHPFADGNGRVGRMLISLMAMTEGLLDMPALYMSPELETRKDAYIDLMYAVSARGEWENWLDFFFSIAEQSARRATATIDAILDLHAKYTEKVKSVSRSSNLLSVIDMLFQSPAVQAKAIVSKIGVTDAAARRMLRQLEGLGILEQWRSFYPTVWIARDLLEVSRPRPDRAITPPVPPSSS
jgi:Fic family protein